MSARPHYLVEFVRANQVDRVWSTRGYDTAEDARAGAKRQLGKPMTDSVTPIVVARISLQESRSGLG